MRFNSAFYPGFSSSGAGGGEGPQFAKQLLCIIVSWSIAKIIINRPKPTHPSAPNMNNRFGHSLQSLNKYNKPPIWHIDCV